MQLDTFPVYRIPHHKNHCFFLGFIAFFIEKTPISSQNFSSAQKMQPAVSGKLQALQGIAAN
ncbi:hypothetical protein [Selenomonas sp.]|uniref:hypothetical protein n=1 Tax=Selenomonas sp. TaxID=2053611 RepID=UPI0025F76CE7|nr:hypothetical protein [Selenomonas sp.]MCI6085965.1 hypothetical protein [Selenomonas sp.]MCI6285088.1 hypothetical protein [Selenomonas sp.]